MIAHVNRSVAAGTLCPPSDPATGPTASPAAASAMMTNIAGAIAPRAIAVNTTVTLTRRVNPRHRDHMTIFTAFMIKLQLEVLHLTATTRSGALIYIFAAGDEHVIIDSIVDQ